MNDTVITKKLMTEIFMITLKIQKESPELYKLLNETPLFLNDNENGITGVDFEQYLESLTMQLLAFGKAA